MEAHPDASPARSITKLGIVRFAIPDDPNAPGEALRPGAIVELPSFSNDDTSRPTVQMPPLAERERPASIDEAFDPGGDGDAPSAGGAQRTRSSTLLGVGPGPVPPRAPI